VQPRETTARGLIEQHLWWAVEETDNGRIDWKRSLRVYAQVKAEAVDATQPYAITGAVWRRSSSKRRHGENR